MTALDPESVARIVDAALREDLGDRGDVTTAAVVPERAIAHARIVARESLVVAGLVVARAVFERLDPSLSWSPHATDGTFVDGGSVLVEIAGSAIAILEGERAALNILMRCCGIATLARQAVLEIEGTGARILDTRKTAPGLRVLDKHAVRSGGARNHRFGLYDAVMIKDTHLGVVGSVREAVRRALAAGHPAERITAEVRDVEQLREAIAAGAGRALLDNMDVADLRRCVAIGKGRIVLEASGGLRPGHLREVAETGVDFLSVGWLTHSARSADVAMEIDVRS